MIKAFRKRYPKFWSSLIPPLFLTKSKLDPKNLFKAHSRIRNILIVDFSNAVIQLVYGELGPGRFKLVDFETKKFSPESEKTKDDQANFINAFLKKRIPVQDNEIILSILDPRHIFIKYVVLPVLPAEEIPGAAQWQLKDEIPLDLPNAYCDWQIIREFTDEDGTKKNGIIFVAGKKDTIDHYLAIIAKCNLQPLKVTTNSFNYLPVFKNQKIKESVTTVLNIEDQDAVLNIYVNDQLNFVRPLRFSWERLTQSLIESSTSEKGKMEQTTQDAENILKTLGIPQEETRSVHDQAQVSQVISWMRPLLEELVRELKFSFDYFVANYSAGRPTKIYLAGSGANLKNLNLYLKKELLIETELIPWPDSVEIKSAKGKLPLEDLNKLTSPIGAALGFTSSINLLPEEIKRKNQRQIQEYYFRLFVLLIGGSCLIFLLIYNFQTRKLQDKLRSAQQRLRTMAVIKDLRQKIFLKEQLIKKIQEDKSPGDRLLRVISEFIPSEIILDEFDFNQKEHRLLLKGKVSGASEDIAQGVLTGFMEKLETARFFLEVNFVSSRRVGMVQEFEIKCDLSH